MKMMEILPQDSTYLQGLTRKLAPPLVTLLSSEAEIQFVALRNINLIVQKRYVRDRQRKVKQTRKEKKNLTKNKRKKKKLAVENPGIDPGTSRMLSERSTI